MRRQSRKYLIVFFVILFIFSFQQSIVYCDEQYNHVITIESPNPENHGWFGYKVEISNEIIAIGAPFADTEYEDAGKIFLYDLEGTLLTTIESPTSRENDEFGYRMDFSHGRLVSGDRSNTEGYRWAGMAHVFSDTGDLLFSKQSPIVKAGSYFGYEAAINNARILIYEPNAKTTPGMAGMVHVYDGEGNYLRNLTSPNPIVGGRFGSTIELGDDLILISEFGSKKVSLPMGPGSVYAFDYDLTHLFTLQAPEPEDHACFGSSISMTDEYIIIGESWATVNNKSRAGRAYIYDINGVLLQTLESPNPKIAGEFGGSVAIDGDRIVVGEFDADVNPGQYEGRAYVYDVEGNLLQSLTAPDPLPRAAFGLDVDIEGDYIVVGECWAASGDLGQVGRVQVYKLESVTPPPPILPGFPVLAILTASVIYYSIRKRMCFNKLRALSVIDIHNFSPKDML